MTRRNLYQLVCLFCLLYTHFRLSYNFNEAWWHSAAGTLTMCVFGLLIWKKQFWQVSGLNIKRGSLLWVCGTTAALALVFAALMLWLAQSEQVDISAGTWRHYLHNAFYILNEEVILGALLLHLVSNRLRIHPVAASALLALVMSLAHLALYKWYFRDKALLLPATVASLFMVVFIKNNLILRFRHIGYAWGLHFAWMAVMYGSLHHYKLTGETLTDIEKFNTYLGAAPVLLLCTVAAATTLLFFTANPRKSIAE